MLMSHNTYGCECESCRFLVKFWSKTFRVTVEVESEREFFLLLDELGADPDRFDVMVKVVN